MIGGKRRCSKGKPCGQTCISGLKICLLDLREGLSKGVGKAKQLVNGLKGSSQSSEEQKAPPPTHLVPKSENNPLADAFQGKDGKKMYNNILEGLQELKGELKPEEIQDLAASHFRQSREFANRLDKNIPQGTKTSIREEDGKIMAMMSTRTKNGDLIEAVFSPKAGFHFVVNGSHDIGTITDPKSQVLVTLAVRSLFKAVAKSLPEGAVMRTVANMNDVRGDRRVEIYNKVGFRLPDKNDNMWGKVVSGGKLVPSSQDEWANTARDRSSAFFTEPLYENLKYASVKDWYHYLFGKSVKNTLE